MTLLLYEYCIGNAKYNAISFYQIHLLCLGQRGARLLKIDGSLSAGVTVVLVLYQMLSYISSDSDCWTKL